MRILASLLCVACCLAGCDRQRFAAIRQQLEALPRYARWDGGPDGRTLVFLQPSLTEADLRELGLRPVVSAPDRLSIRYRYRVAGRGPGLETELAFRLEHGKIQAVVFPRELVDLIGQANVARLLRIAGGHAGKDSGLASVPKSQVLARATADLVAASRERRIKVAFIPPTPAERALTVHMEENAAGNAYHKFSVDLRSWEKQQR